MRYRREAIDRAYARFVYAEDAGRSDAEIGGLGLLVMQRALLAAEDLGGLLHAFRAPDSWARLVRATVPELDEAFENALVNPRDALAAFRLIDRDALESEVFNVDERAALEHLIELTERRWRALLRSAAELWLTHGRSGKATMHGFPVVAGEHVLGPPPAGDLAADIEPSPHGRFAIVVSSHVRGTHVITDRTSVRLDRQAVLAMRGQGRTAARLVRELCEAQAGTIMSGHRVAVPLAQLDQLSETERRIVEVLVERRRAEEIADADA